MSLAGHVLWNRQTIGVCDLAIIGKPSAALPATTPVAAFRNLRRVFAVVETGWAERDFDLRAMAPPGNCLRNINGARSCRRSPRCLPQVQSSDLRAIIPAPGRPATLRRSAPTWGSPHQAAQRLSEGAAVDAPPLSGDGDHAAWRGSAKLPSWRVQSPTIPAAPA